MRISAIATDHRDFTSALRLEFGLLEQIAENDEVIVIAPPDLEDERLRELTRIVLCTQVPAVIMPLPAVFKFDTPANILVVSPDDTRVQLGLGWTLWAPLDPAAPLLLLRLNGGGAIRVEPSGLTCLPELPLGPESSPEAGVARACQRLMDRFLAFGRMRSPTLMAA